MLCEYLKKEWLISLCRALKMCDEIIIEVCALADILRADAIEPHFERLLSIETAKDAYNAIVQVLDSDPLSCDPRGMKLLTVYLAAALHTRELYKEKCISDVIFVDSLKCLTRFIGEYRVIHDCFGFDRSWWAYRQLSLNLFRLGTLEFEMRTYSENSLPNGQPSIQPRHILSVHIPSDAELTREALDASYESAKRFFAEFFSEFRYEGIYCDTWLLAPVLREMLNPTSKILNFQDDYEILSTNPNDMEFIYWIFKKDGNNPDNLGIEALPETTTLMRAVKNHLRKGGKVGSALGRYKGTPI